MDLSEYKLNEIENLVFADTFIISPRVAAKAILAVMDESFNDTKFFSTPAITHIRSESRVSVANNTNTLEDSRRTINLHTIRSIDFKSDIRFK